jgi:molybdopterin-guanine dinucleotide biosynthesis protein A
MGADDTVRRVATFTGAVLTGGASVRMGRDKAFLEVDGVPLVLRVADALEAAGAAEVLTVGGDRSALVALGLDARADPRQGDGPLGGLLTALELASHDRVVVLATDLAFVTGAVVAALVAGLDRDPSPDVAAARAADTPEAAIEPLCAAWRRRRCAAHLGAAHAAGERAVHRAMAGLAVVAVDVPAVTVSNANRPDDLRR